MIKVELEESHINTLLNILGNIQCKTDEQSLEMHISIVDIIKKLRLALKVNRKTKEDKKI